MKDVNHDAHEEHPASSQQGHEDGWHLAKRFNADKLARR
jgi:hypothetical protein